MFSSSRTLPRHAYCRSFAVVAGEKLLVPPVLLVEPRQEALSEDEDLLLALAQRRNANLHDVEAVVEVFTELTAGERLLEIAIGRRHDPGVHVDHPVASDAGEAEVLQDVQELGLKGTGKLGDLVEVDRPLVGVLELARLSAVRPGERALFVAEELRLEEPGGNRGAVDLDEGATAASRGGVDGSRDEVLADAAFPTEDRPHRRAAVEERGVLGEIPFAVDRRDGVAQRSSVVVAGKSIQAHDDLRGPRNVRAPGPIG